MRLYPKYVNRELNGKMANKGVTVLLESMANKGSHCFTGKYGKQGKSLFC